MQSKFQFCFFPCSVHKTLKVTVEFDTCKDSFHIGNAFYVFAHRFHLEGFPELRSFAVLNFDFVHILYIERLAEHSHYSYEIGTVNLCEHNTFYYSMFNSYFVHRLPILIFLFNTIKIIAKGGVKLMSSSTAVLGRMNICSS